MVMEMSVNCFVFVLDCKIWSGVKKRKWSEKNEIWHNMDQIPNVKWQDAAFPTSIPSVFIFLAAISDVSFATRADRFSATNGI